MAETGFIPCSLAPSSFFFKLDLQGKMRKGIGSGGRELIRVAEWTQKSSPVTDNVESERILFASVHTYCEVDDVDHDAGKT